MTPHPMRLGPGPDVYGPAEVRRVLRIGQQRLSQLARRDDFPTARDLEIGRVWDGAEIRAWALSRHGGALQGRPILAALRAWRDTGVLAEAGRQAGVTPETVARWLKRIDAPVPRHG